MELSFLFLACLIASSPFAQDVTFGSEIQRLPLVDAHAHPVPNVSLEKLLAAMDRAGS